MNDALLTELFARDADAVLRAEKAAQAREGDDPVPFTPSFEKRMDDLCARMRTGKYRRVYGNARVMLIAAVIMVFLMTVTAGAVWYRATVRYDPDWGENVYHVEGGRDEGLPADVRPTFIPARFTETVSETRTEEGYQLVMEAANGDVLAVTVRAADNDHLFDAERGENDWIESDGQRYFRHRAVTETKPRTFEVTLFLSDDRYIVNVSEWTLNGYASDGELVSIIRSIPIWSY